MKSTAILALLFACGGSPPPPSSQPARAPDPVVGRLQQPRPDFSATPASRVFGGWLEAFNTGDEARIRAFAAAYRYPAPDELVALRARIGALRLVSLGLGFEVEAGFVAKEQAGPDQLVGWFEVTATTPPVIVAFELEEVPPGASLDDAIDAVKQRASSRSCRSRCGSRSGCRCSGPT